MFILTEDQLELKEYAFAAAKRIFEATAKEDDEQELFRPELLQRFGEEGFCGVPSSAEYGGMGLGYFEYALVLEELAKIWDYECGTYGSKTDPDAKILVFSSISKL